MSDSSPMILEPSGRREIVITRSFKVLREQIFEAFIDTEMLKLWMRAQGWELTVCEVDATVGGLIRYVWSKQGEPDMGLSGEFLEIKAPECLVHTELFDEDWTGGTARVTTRFDEYDVLTRMTMTVRYASQKARDATLQSGMEQGVAENFDNLEELLASRIEPVTGKNESITGGGRRSPG